MCVYIYIYYYFFIIILQYYFLGNCDFFFFTVLKNSDFFLTIPFTACDSDFCSSDKKLQLPFYLFIFLGAEMHFRRC